MQRTARRKPARTQDGQKVTARHLRKGKRIPFLQVPAPEQGPEAKSTTRSERDASPPNQGAGMSMNKPTESVDRLWKEYRKSRSPEIREKLVLRYVSLVKYVAGRLAIGLPPSVQADDLISSGILGLMDAIDKYDLERDTRFETYAVTRIRGAILDELRALDWIPRSTRQKARRLES